MLLKAETNAPLDAARAYIRRGLVVIPIPRGEKRPRISGWQNLRLGEADLPTMFSGSENVGVILGQVSGYLIDVDLDCTEALACADYFLPNTSSVFGRASKPRSHRLYRVSPSPHYLKFEDPRRGRSVSGNTIIELRQDGHQTLFPPSEADGEIRVWCQDGDPPLVDEAILSRAVARLAAASLLVRYWPESGRHEARMALGGGLARAGWSEDDVIAFVQNVVQVAQPDDHEAYGKVIGDTHAAFRKLRVGEPITGIPRLAGLVGEMVGQRVREWLDLDDARKHEKRDCMSRPNPTDDWRKPEQINCELPPVEAFSQDLLPISFRSLAQDVADRMQVPIDYPAIAMVLCLAGVVNRRACVQPKVNDSGWLVVPNLWGGIIAPPGFMKSPVIQCAIRPLNQIQTDWRQEYEDAQKNYAIAKEEYELRCAAWKEQYKASSKKKTPIPIRPDDEPEQSKLRRLIVNDATFEALHQTMSENPAGIFVIRDELTGWWSTLDRAGREGERAFCLQAWNGDTGHIIDRIGRGTIYVEACCMSMLGGIQPGRLRSYMVDALEDGPSNDGLIQRFQLLVWPNTNPGWTYVDRPPDAASEQQVEQVFRKLVQLNVESPKVLHFSTEAQELFVAWLEELERKVRSDDIHPALVSHLSKYRKLMPSLALLFELAEWAAGNSPAETISMENARKAVAWCKYLESHARRVYSCVVTPQLRAARDLADKLKKRKIGTEGSFSCREVYLKGWTGLDTPEAVKLAAEVLQDAGWLMEMPGEPRPLGGRPSNRYMVNPRIWE
ncbi:MAG: DUF3987 domain-containing protein [Acidobacteriia bacterium]|nr:DUF3987 domain-containing protein [Terriglobia bacterium]